MAKPKELCCNKVGCKETDVVTLRTFGAREVQLCMTHCLAWGNDEEARRLGFEARLHDIAIEGHTYAGRVDDAQAAARAWYAQETENRAYVDVWLSRIG